MLLCFEVHTPPFPSQFFFAPFVLRNWLIFVASHVAGIIFTRLSFDAVLCNLIFLMLIFSAHLALRIAPIVIKEIEFEIEDNFLGVLYIKAIRQIVKCISRRLSYNKQCSWTLKIVTSLKYLYCYCLGLSMHTT